MDAKTREDVSVEGEGDDIERCRLTHRRIFLTVRDFARCYLMQFVMEHSGKHL